MKSTLKVLYTILLSVLLIIQSVILIAWFIAIIEYPNAIYTEIRRNGFYFYLISAVPFFTFGYFFIQELLNKKSNIYKYPKFIYFSIYILLLILSFLFIFFLSHLLFKINLSVVLNDYVILFLLPILSIYITGIILTIKKFCHQVKVNNFS